jgi:hypothetical protein
LKIYEDYSSYTEGRKKKKTKQTIPVVILQEKGLVEKKSSCLGLLNARISGMCYHDWLKLIFFKNSGSNFLYIFSYSLAFSTSL